jgi:hypothetical protein
MTLYWKRMPPKAFMAGEKPKSGFKALKEVD